MLETFFSNIMIQGWQFNIAVVLLALILDFLIGDPKQLYDKIRHPVVWIGNFITTLEARLYRAARKPSLQIIMGSVLVLLTVTACVATGMVITWLANKSGYGWLIIGIIGSVFLAGRSLLDHVSRVARCLILSLEDGRKAVAHIVGRDPEQLDEAGVGRAALESLAENFSDGVVAPVFWFLLGGLPGLLGYKAINTLDSMIGHKCEKYLYFGRVAARLDDVVNWVPARLTGALFCLSALIMPGASLSGAVRSMMRDARNHNSPNAGWQEAALAGALGLALAGPRNYGGIPTQGDWMGDGRSEVSPTDITRGCVLYKITCGIILIILLAGLLI